MAVCARAVTGTVCEDWYIWTENWYNMDYVLYCNLFVSASECIQSIYLFIYLFIFAVLYWGNAETTVLLD